MVLIFGAHGSGKSEFAKSIQNGSQTIIDHLEKIVWDDLSNAKKNVNKIVVENPKGIIICDEIGCGLVPIDKIEREFRDVLGQILIELASVANDVFYVTMGIWRKIK